MKKILIIILVVILVVILGFFIYICVQKRILRNMAIETIKALNKYGVEYWVDFGTLLGIFREGDILLLDHDVDISIVGTPDLKTKMVNVKSYIEKRGYKFIKEKWGAYRVKYLQFWTDLYINTKDTKNGVYKGATGTKSNIPMKYVGNPVMKYWKKGDVNFRAPEKIHDTLVWRYGNDYMTRRYFFKGRDGNKKLC